jgi:hypothetical protein
MCQCPICLEIAAAQAAEVERIRIEMWFTTIAYVAQRHGLDNTDAARHVRLHAISGPGMIQ